MTISATPLFEDGQHLRKQRLVVLQVCVDDRDIGRGRCEHGFGAGRGQAAAAQALHAADARIEPCLLANPV